MRPLPPLLHMALWLLLGGLVLVAANHYGGVVGGRVKGLASRPGRL